MPIGPTVALKINALNSEFKFSYNFQRLVSVLDPMSSTCSVTRIGQISPLWQNFINLCQMVEGLFSVWQKFEPALAKYV